MKNIFKKIKNIYICVIVVMVLILVLGIVFSVVYLLNQLNILTDEDLASFTEISGSSSGSSSTSETSDFTNISISENSQFVELARILHETLRTGGYTYKQESHVIPITKDTTHTIDCSSYVTWVLYEYQYKSLAGYQLSCSGGELVKWCRSNLTEVWSGCTRKLKDIGDYQAGDIYIRGYESQAGGDYTYHTQIFAGFTSSGVAIWYDCGDNGPIQEVEGEYTYNDLEDDNDIVYLYVYRVPTKT